MYKIILTLHIIAGFLALSSGLVAMLSKKGSKRHKLFGLIYFCCMCFVCFSAIGMSILKPNMFLLSIGIFSFYLAFTGYRHTKNKSGQLALIDKAIMIGTLIASVGMLAQAYQLLDQPIQDDAIVLFIFGGTCFAMAIQDTLGWLNVLQKQHWLMGHIARIGGSYIATVTAFATTNLQYWPQIINWLLPSVIGSILITYTSLKFRKKSLPG